MRTAVFSVAIACVLGCGGDAGGGDDGSDALVGVWAHQLTGDFDCVRVMEFGDDGSYENALACALTSGDIGIESSRGTYEVDGDELVLAIDASSCPTVSSRALTMTIERADTLLRLSDGDGVLVLEPLETGGGGSANGVYGCWAEDGSGAFNPRPVSTL